MIKKYELLIFILFVFNAVGCHSQKETISFEINKNANDSLPVKVEIYGKREQDDSVNIGVYVLRDIIIKSTYYCPLNVAGVQHYYNIDSLPENRHTFSLFAPTVVSIIEPDKIGAAIFDIDKNLPANDSVHVKFAVHFYLRIALKDKDALMQYAKLSQTLAGYEIYDVGKFGSFEKFIHTYIPEYKFGRIMITVGKYHELPFITTLRIPMDP